MALEATIGYYPEDDAPMYEGDIKLFDVEKESPISPKVIQVVVNEDPSLTFDMMKRVERPMRTQFVAYFTSRVNEIITCNVDLELPKDQQPDDETVARYILGARPVITGEAQPTTR